MTTTGTNLPKSEQALAGGSPNLGQEGRTRLPGLTLVFFIGLCVSGVLCALGIFFSLQELIKGVAWQYNAKYIYSGLTAAGVLGAGLCWWAGYGIYERLTSAPFRCRVLLLINIIASAAGFVGIIIFLFINVNMSSQSASDIMMRYNLPGLASNLLAVIIISEVWRRYFFYSAKVRQAFNLYLPAESARELPPAEIGLFTAACCLCPAYYGLPNLVWLHEIYSTVMNGGIAFLLLHAVIAASCLILPFVALYALHVRRLPVIFWSLGLWLGLQGVIWLVNVGNTFQALGNMGTYDQSYNYSWGLPRLFSERLFIPLAFWWYFSVSDKARSWFEVKRPYNEHPSRNGLSNGA